MKFIPLAALLLVAGVVLTAQEGRKIPRDSELISIPGCAKDRVFIVGASPEHEPVATDIPPGRRFRLNGPKAILQEIKKREGMMVEVIGLVRKRDLAGPGGVGLFGGRVRVGGVDPRAPISNPGRDPMYNQAVIDVESWRLLSESCPGR